MVHLITQRPLMSLGAFSLGPPGFISRPAGVTWIYLKWPRKLNKGTAGIRLYGLVQEHYWGFHCGLSILTWKLLLTRESNGQFFSKTKVWSSKSSWFFKAHQVNDPPSNNVSVQRHLATASLTVQFQTSQLKLFQSYYMLKQFAGFHNCLWLVRRLRMHWQI